MTITRRSALATTLLTLSGAVAAQGSPALKMVVPFGAGTTTDIVARHVGEAIAAAVRERRQYSITHRLVRPNGDIRIVQEVAQIFFDEKTGVVALGSQTCQSTALYSGLVPDPVRPLAMERLLERREERLASLTKLYGAVDPNRPLERGFARVHKADGSLVRSAASLASGEAVQLVFADGDRGAVVDGTPAPRPAQIGRAHV